LVGVDVVNGKKLLITIAFIALALLCSRAANMGTTTHEISPPIWEEIAIPVTYQADRKTAEAILLRAANERNEKFFASGTAALDKMQSQFFMKGAGALVQDENSDRGPKCSWAGSPWRLRVDFSAFGKTCIAVSGYCPHSWHSDPLF
jgi:hypothetical protein